jgi:hypothetical protein
MKVHKKNFDVIPKLPYEKMEFFDEGTFWFFSRLLVEQFLNRRRGV